MAELLIQNKLRFACLVVTCDNDLFREISQILEKNQIVIVHAKSSLELMDLLSKHEFDTIIYDFGSSNIQFFESIEETALHQEKPPFIFGIDDNPKIESLIALVKTGYSKDLLKRQEIIRLYPVLKRLKEITLQEKLFEHLMLRVMKGEVPVEKVKSVMKFHRVFENRLGSKNDTPSIPTSTPQDIVQTLKTQNIPFQEPLLSKPANEGLPRVVSSNTPIVHGTELTAQNALAPVTEKTFHSLPNNVPSQSKNEPPVQNKDEKPLSHQEEMMVLRKELRSGKMELPSIPAVAQEFMKMMKVGNVQKYQVVKLLERDQAITSKVIMAANAAYYQRAKKCRSIEEAIIRLGFRELYNIVKMVFLGKFFKLKNPDYQPVMLTIWNNTIATAYIGRRITEFLKIPEAETVYLSGLFINIGEPFIVKLFSDNVRLMQDMNRIEKLADKYHNEFGFELLKNWKFDNEQIHICSHHHDNEKDLSILNFPGSDVVVRNIHILNISHFLAEEAGYEYFNMSNTPKRDIPSFDASMDFLKISDQNLDDCEIGLKEFVDATAVLL